MTCEEIKIPRPVKGCQGKTRTPALNSSLRSFVVDFSHASGSLEVSPRRFNPCFHLLPAPLFLESLFFVHWYQDHRQGTRTRLELDTNGRDPAETSRVGVAENPVAEHTRRVVPKSCPPLRQLIRLTWLYLF